MNHQTRQIPRSTPEVQIYQENLQRRASIKVAKEQSSIMPSGKTMIMAALGTLVVALLGYLTYRILKKKEGDK